MPGYIIAQLRDSADLAKYREEVTPINAQFGARLLAKPDSAICVEGEWEYDRIVILELPSIEAARAFNSSPEYKRVKQLRDHLPAFTVLIVDGA